MSFFQFHDYRTSFALEKIKEDTGLQLILLDVSRKYPDAEVLVDDVTEPIAQVYVCENKEDVEEIMDFIYDYNENIFGEDLEKMLYIRTQSLSSFLREQRITE